MNKDGKLEKMKAYCRHENTPITDPLLEPTHYNKKYIKKDMSAFSA